MIFSTKSFAQAGLLQTSFPGCLLTEISVDVDEKSGERTFYVVCLFAFEPSSEPDSMTRPHVFKIWLPGLVVGQGAALTLDASSTMSTRSEDLATAMTWRPRPLPCAAPSMIPGRSSSWILASL